MAYLNDPRENHIGPYGKVWENDNRVEKRYYWNGAYVDFCNLPPEDYAKTIFHTDGNGGTSGGDTPVTPGKTSNKIWIDEESEPGKVTYTARSEKPVASDTDVTLKIKTSEGYKTHTLTISNGESASAPYVVEYAEDEMKPRQEDLSSQKDSDSKYNYEVEKPEILPYVYSLPMSIGSVDNMSEEEIWSNAEKEIPENMENKMVTEPFTVDIPYVDCPGYFGEGLAEEEIPLDKYNSFYAEKTNDIVLVIDKKAVGEGINAEFPGTIELYDPEAKMGFPDDMSLWSLGKTIIEPGTGKRYYQWVRREANPEDGGMVNIQDPEALDIEGNPRKSEDISPIFKITLNE